MTRRKRARARRARNAFARRMAQRYRAQGYGTAQETRARHPVAAWCEVGAMRLRGPERRRLTRASRRIAAWAGAR